MFCVMTVFGTRPEAIKLAPVIKELRRHADRIRTLVTVTAQHREMLDQVLSVFDIHVDHDLNIMTQEQSLSSLTAKLVTGLDPILNKEKVNLLLVQGDTTTTLAASLVAFYHKIPIGHVEAGLRTQDRYYPFPEEMNRVLTSRLAAIHFAPTKLAKENILKEGIAPHSIVVTGNTVIDALLDVVAREGFLEKRKPDGQRRENSCDSPSERKLWKAPGKHLFGPIRHCKGSQGCGNCISGAFKSKRATNCQHDLEWS